MGVGSGVGVATGVGSGVGVGTGVGIGVEAGVGVGPSVGVGTGVGVESLPQALNAIAAKASAPSRARISCCDFDTSDFLRTVIGADYITWSNAGYLWRLVLGSGGQADAG